MPHNLRRAFVTEHHNVISVSSALFPDILYGFHWSLFVEMVEVTTRHSGYSTLNVEMNLGISSLPMDRASSCSSTEEAPQPQIFGQSLQKPTARSASACLKMYCQLCLCVNGSHSGAIVWASGTSLLSLGFGGQLLQQWVGLALGRFDAVGPHDAGGPVKIEHHH